MVEEKSSFEENSKKIIINDQQVYGEFKSRIEPFSDESKLPYELLLERKNLVDIKVDEQEFRGREETLKAPEPTQFQNAQLKLYQIVDTINECFRKKPDQLEAPQSQLNDNSNKVIKCMSWHPQHRVLAVCNKNDVIYIYYFPNQDMYGMNSVKPLTLWFELQSKVCDIQWKPFLPYTLAVATENGVVIWEIDISDLKPELKKLSIHYKVNQSKTCSNILNYPYYQPTTITWSSDGLQLACGSPKHPSILLWDVASRVPTFIPRHYGNNFLVWSPKNYYILSCGGEYSRIYDGSNWSYNDKEWKMLSNYQTGAWSEKGEYLAVGSGDKIHFIQCINKAFDSGGETVYIERTSTYKVPQQNNLPSTSSSNNDLYLGGYIKKIAWSPDNQRLAVIFYLNSKSKTNDQYCAIYKVKTYPKFSVTPRGYIRSKDQPINSISFVPNYKK
ncbi:hypothetical protein DICPUDRAFT_56766, partial [Dictyostelium purpureum]